MALVLLERKVRTAEQMVRHEVFIRVADMSNHSQLEQQ